MVIWSNPLLKQGHPEQAAQDVVQMAFEDLQKARDSTTSLGNLFKCLTTATVKQANRNFLDCCDGVLCVLICDYCFMLSPGITEKSSIFFVSHQVLINIGKIPLNFLQAEHSQLTQSLFIRQMLQSLNDICGLFAGYAPVRPCLHCTEEPIWMQHSRMCLISAEQRGKVTNLDLLVMLFLMLLRVPLVILAMRVNY